MSESSQLMTWEENTERRVGIVEAKVDKLMDPEVGIYPKLEQVQSKLKGWAIAILSAVLVDVVVQVALQR